VGLGAGQRPVPPGHPVAAAVKDEDENRSAGDVDRAEQPGVDRVEVEDGEVEEGEGDGQRGDGAPRPAAEPPPRAGELLRRRGGAQVPTSSSGIAKPFSR
jgi:hypothetical protein